MSIKDGTTKHRRAFDRDPKMALDNFMKRVNKTKTCWLWTGAKHESGYAQIQSMSGRVRVSRWIWAYFNGPIPPGHHICHKCDNPPCVRPDHLFAGTNSENIQDSLKKGRFVIGSKRSQSKLTEDKVKMARALYSSGKSGRSIAKKFKVSETTMRMAIKRQTWKHVH